MRLKRDKLFKWHDPRMSREARLRGRSNMIAFLKTAGRTTVIGFVVAVGLCASAFAQSPIKLKVAYWGPNTTHYFAGVDLVLGELERRTNGRLSFERYYSGSLVGAREIPDALENGIADIGTVLSAYYPAKFPLANVGSLAGLNYHLWPVIMAYYQTYRDVPAFKDQLEKRGIRMMMPMGYGPYYVWSQKPIETIDDLKGLKFRGVGDQAKLLAALGVTPVFITPPEIYDALSKGTIDGLLGDWDIAHGYKLYDVAKFHSLLPVGTSAAFLAMSTRTWNKLPADIQKILDDFVPEATRIFARDYEITGFGEAKAAASAAGVKVVPVKAGVGEKVLEVAKRVSWEPWVKDMESKGLPGRKVLDTYIANIKKFVPQDTLKYD